jgi:phosphate transport system substrate-binding protein
MYVFGHFLGSVTRPALALPLLAGLCLSACGPREARFNEGFCSIGSEELNTALDHWLQRWQKRQGGPDAPPPATLQDPRPIHEGRGTATAPEALRKGICDLAPMSRPMTDAELHGIVLADGTRPLAIPIAVEALAIIVPSGSYVRGLTSEQVRTIFSRTPHTLEELFPYIAGTRHAGRELDAFGINSASDRYRWFREAALGGAEISDRVVEVAGPLELVDRVGQSRHAFGYARPAETTPAVKALPIDGVELNDASVRGGAYPFTRYYYIYLPPPNGERPNPQAVEFVRFVLSAEQQAILRPLGLYPLSASDRVAALDRLP